MAATTVSMPPCAVCTITGTNRSSLAKPRQHRHAVEVGHDQVEDDESVGVAFGAGQACNRLLAAGNRGRAVAEAFDRGGEEPALDRIVIDDEDGG